MTKDVVISYDVGIWKTKVKRFETRTCHECDVTLLI